MPLQGDSIQISVLVLWLWLSFFSLTLVHAAEQGLNVAPTPNYCINVDVLRIFQPRIDRCLAPHTPNEELHYLRHASVSHYQAAQELVAYQYFTNPRNPHRRVCDDAELEYIPFLPLGTVLPDL